MFGSLHISVVKKYSVIMKYAPHLCLYLIERLKWVASAVHHGNFLESKFFSILNRF